MKHHHSITALLIAVSLLLAGCHHNTTSTVPAVPVDVRVAQYVQIVATANSNLVPVVSSLKDAGVISAANAQKIAQYQMIVANATKGMAGILAQSTTPWTDKAILIQNLALTLVPPAGYESMGVKTDAQWQALVVALDGMESTIKIIVQMAQVQK